MVKKDKQYNRVYWTDKIPTEKEYRTSVPLTHWLLYEKMSEYVNPNDIVLDVGCGSGGGSALLSHKCLKVIGIDPGKEAIDYANKYNKKINTEYIQNSIEDFPEQKFDFICLMAVIEHIPDERKAIEKCLRMLNKSGKLIIYWSTDNYTIEEIKEILKDLNYELKEIELDRLEHTAYWSIITKRIKVSIGCLIFKSIKYIDFIWNNIFKYTPMINTDEAEFYFITNNATDKVLDYLKINKIPHVVFTTPYKQKEYPKNIADIYRAWNYAVKCAKGEIVVLINSDMFFSKGWLENLIKDLDKKKFITSRLVESGKLRSTFPYTISKNFGTTPETFKEKEFIEYAELIKQERILPRGTFMPLAIYKEIFIKSGGYPLGNIKGLGGDLYFVYYILKPLGINHYTAMDSIVYHIQEGEVDEYYQK